MTAEELASELEDALCGQHKIGEEEYNCETCRLRVAQAEVDEMREAWDSVLEKRRRKVVEARAAGVSIYRIAKILGVKDGAVRQMLGLRSKS